MNRFVGVLLAVIVVLALIFFFPESKVGVFKKEHVKEFNISVFHTRYEPNSISVEQGDLVQLNVVTAEGTASYSHGITIDDYGINELVTSETTPKEIAFRADKKGTFQAYCGTCIDGPFGRDAPDKRMTLIVN